MRLSMTPSDARAQNQLRHNPRHKLALSQHNAFGSRGTKYDRVGVCASIKLPQNFSGF
jgi:hypothetical protein